MAFRGDMPAMGAEATADGADARHEAAHRTPPNLSGSRYLAAACRPPSRSPWRAWSSLAGHFLEQNMRTPRPRRGGMEAPHAQISTGLPSVSCAWAEHSRAQVTTPPQEGQALMGCPDATARQ